MTVESPLFFKDTVLDELAANANVAQFVSFGPDLVQRYSRVRAAEPNVRFASPVDGVTALLANSPDGMVNVRTFDPAAPESREFLYGLHEPEIVLAHLRRLSGQGLYTIANETVDVHDGGVSGVVLGDLIEFAPEDTPRAVEKPGVASLPRAVATRVLETVYGFSPALDFPRDERIEFSLHPVRRGVRHEHTIVWERRKVDVGAAAAAWIWPNRFSRFIGDKVYGLLIADAVGLPVPRATAISRRVAPFRLGTSTGTGEQWVRTSPTEQVPGKFTTTSHWVDPFDLLAREDPSGKALAAVLIQEGVDAQYSGALLAQASGEPVIEGVRGQGDVFMLGERGPDPMPRAVQARVRALYDQATSRLGPVRFEWVDDGDRAWVVQLHRGATLSDGATIVPGTPTTFRLYDVQQGIEGLRTLIAEAKTAGDGIVLIGHVGVTSHFGDVLRRAGVPSRLERER